MEGLNEKLDRVNNDVSQIIELYDFAEKLYPYENIRQPLKVSIIHIHIIPSSTRMISAETLLNLHLTVKVKAICRELVSGAS